MKQRRAVDGDGVVLAAPGSSTAAVKVYSYNVDQWVEVTSGVGSIATDCRGNIVFSGGTSEFDGIFALLAGTSYLDRDPRIRLVSPILADVSQDLGETLHLARLDGDQVVYLATAESREYARLLPRVGRRLFAVHTSLGKAILAERPDAVPSELPPPPLPAPPTNDVTLTYTAPGGATSTITLTGLPASVAASGSHALVGKITSGTDLLRLP